METAELFAKAISNLKVGDTVLTINARRDEITKALNKSFRSKEGCTDYKLMVGSFGQTHSSQRCIRPRHDFYSTS